jgi:hypothetical protein
MKYMKWTPRQVRLYLTEKVHWLGRQQVGKAHWETRSITMAILSKLPDTS